MSVAAIAVIEHYEINSLVFVASTYSSRQAIGKKVDSFLFTAFHDCIAKRGFLT